MTTKAGRDKMRAAGMAHAKLMFEEGDRGAIFSAVILAAMGRDPLPDWAREPLRAAVRALGRGEYKDINEAFGWSQKGEKSKRSRVEGARRRAVEHRVFDWLIKQRSRGRAMDSDAFDEVASECGVGRRVIQNIWRDRKEEVESISARGPTEGRSAMVFLGLWDE